MSSIASPETADSDMYTSALPTVAELRSIMRDLAEGLYLAWLDVISNRLRHLEFEGFVTKDDVQVPMEVWRLPNDEVRYALCKLEDELQSLGYDYEFRFDNVDDASWIMFYTISLPDREDPGGNDVLTVDQDMPLHDLLMKVWPVSSPIDEDLDASDP